MFCEQKLKSASYINFLPFVGADYDKTKVLVMGESHYIGDKDLSKLNEWNSNRNFTREVILDDYLGEIREDGSHPYQSVKCFRNTAALLTGKDYSDSDYVWKRLAFYDFFQRIIGINSDGKQFVDKDLIEDSRKAFYELLDILNPKLVIAWGVGDLYDKWVPQDSCSFPDASNRNLYFYNSHPGNLIYHIKHPSHGFSIQDERVKLLQVFSAAKINSEVFK